MNITEYLNAVINTLEQVRVSGSENWNKMLGCVQMLKKICDELKIVTDTAVQADDKEEEHASKNDLCG